MVMVMGMRMGIELMTNLIIFLLVEGFWHFNRAINRIKGIKNRGFRLIACGGGVLLLHLALDRRFQSGEIIHAKSFGKLVIHFHIIIFADFGDLHLKDTVLAGQMRGRIFRRKRHLNINGGIGFRANQAIFKTRNKAV